MNHHYECGCGSRGHRDGKCTQCGQPTRKPADLAAERKAAIDAATKAGGHG